MALSTTGFEKMGNGDKNIDVRSEQGTEKREHWVKPEIVSFVPVSATNAATRNPGDAFSSQDS